MVVNAVFRAFVMMSLWNWFVTVVFNVSNISFLNVLGFSLLISLFSDSGNFSVEDRRWRVLMTAVEYCVPQERHQALREHIKDEFGDETTMLWHAFITSFFGYATALVLGFVVHLFAQVA